MYVDIALTIVSAGWMRAGLAGSRGYTTPTYPAATVQADLGPYTTLFHGSDGALGKIGSGRFSTTTSRAHAEQYGNVAEFRVPTRKLYEIQDAGGVRELRDLAAGGNGISAIEWRFLGDFSKELNNYRVK
jgi:hypothetical protein